MSITFRCITPEERHNFREDIGAIEQIARYPLGNDFFQIDHGQDYFAFFDRLGRVNYYIALEGETVVAVGAGVLRQIAYHQGETRQCAWYLCDLKVHPAYQNRHLSLRMLRYAVAENIKTCNRGYAISMNPGDFSPNRLVQVFGKVAPVQFNYATTLGIYSGTAEAMGRIEPILMQHRGAVSYLSLKGVKDLRLQSNGQILPLLHVQWGATAQTTMPHPLPGYAHMFCCPETDELAQVLSQHGWEAIATASVIHHGMAESDWQFILTSDI